jgi:hypothetical protein
MGFFDRDPERSQHRSLGECVDFTLRPLSRLCMFEVASSENQGQVMGEMPHDCHDLNISRGHPRRPFLNCSATAEDLQ